MREFDVLDVIIAGLKTYAGATAVFREDRSNQSWVNTPRPFVTFGMLVAETPDPRQNSELHPRMWRNVDSGLSEGYQTDVELVYVHQPHITLSLNCYADIPGLTTGDDATVEAFSQKVREWFLAAGRLDLEQIKARTYYASPIRDIDALFNTENDALARRQMDIELVVAKAIWVQVPSIEKVVLDGRVKAEGADEYGPAEMAEIASEDFIE